MYQDHLDRGVALMPQVHHVSDMSAQVRKETLREHSRRPPRRRHLLVIVPLGFTICFTLLQQLFEYPDILRQPTAEILAKFAVGGAPLVAVWCVLTLTAVAFVPLVLLVHRVPAERAAPAPVA